MKKFIKYLFFIALPFLIYILNFLLEILLPVVYSYFGQEKQMKAVAYDNNFEATLYLGNRRFIYFSLILFVGSLIYKLIKKQKLTSKKTIFFILYVLYYFLAYFVINLILNFFGLYTRVF